MWETLFGSGMTAIGMLITYLTFIRGRDREIQKEATEKATQSAQLRHIGSGVDEIKQTMSTNDEKMAKMGNDIIRIDESTKSAHKRIDNIVKKGTGLND